MFMKKMVNGNIVNTDTLDQKLNKIIIIIDYVCEKIEIPIIIIIIIYKNIDDDIFK